MRKIVLIEDDIMLGQNLIEMLEEENFEVLHATDGRKGIELIKKSLPDIVISDILMPECSGLEIKETLNMDPLASTIPFIFLTAKADKQDVRRGMEIGADDYLTKPFVREELMNSINSRLRKSDILKKHRTDLTQSIAFALPHEFNNPLISILGYSEIILDLANKCEHSRCSDIMSYTKVIDSAGRELLSLLKRYLLVVKLEMIFSDPKEVAKYNEKKASFLNTRNVEDFIFNILGTYNGRYSYKCDAENVFLNCSDEDFDLAIKEIIDNAFKFARNETEISINCKNDNDYFIIEIKNLGRGMTEDQVSNIGLFQQFEREKYEQRGMGLGLAIASKLIKINGGKLDIKSALNSETCVTLYFPIKVE